MNRDSRRRQEDGDDVEVRMFHLLPDLGVEEMKVRDPPLEVRVLITVTGFRESQGDLGPSTDSMDSF